MKKIFQIFILMVVSLSFLSCEKKFEATKVDGFETYIDVATDMKIEYPKNWHIGTKRPGLIFQVFSDKLHRTRFLWQKGHSKGAPGAKIQVITIKLDSTKTIDSVFKDNKRFLDHAYKEAGTVTMDGVKMHKWTYEFPLDDGQFKGEMYIGFRDSMATTFAVEAFGDKFEEYKKTAFDKAIKSLIPGTFKVEEPADTNFVAEEQPFPSDTLKKVHGKGFTMEIPQNFRKEAGGYYMGTRRGDSYLKVDVTDFAKDANFKKSVDASKAKFTGASAPKAIKIDGTDAYTFSYKPSGKVNGEVYFVAKGDKLYQITINWFKPEAKNYKDIFKKCAKTFKFK